MAYGARYRYRWVSINGNVGEVLLLQEGYTGEVTDRPLGRAPELIMEQSGHIHGTSLQLYLECEVDGEYTALYTSSAKEWQVQLWWNGREIWRGYLTPELYSEPDIAPPYDVCVTATDGLGELKRSEYKPSSWDLSLEDHLLGILDQTGLTQALQHTGGLSADGRNGSNLLREVKVDLAHEEGKTCYEVLEGLLTALNAELTTWHGVWMLIRPTDLDEASEAFALYPSGGGGALTWDIPEYGSSRTHGRWPVGHMDTQIIAAKSAVTVQSPNHLQEERELSADGWSGSGTLAIYVEAGQKSADGTLITESHWELAGDAWIQQSVKYTKGLGAHTLTVDSLGIVKVRAYYTDKSGTHTLGYKDGAVGWDNGGGDVVICSGVRGSEDISIPVLEGAGTLKVMVQHVTLGAVNPVAAVYGVRFALTGVAYGLELRLALANGARSEGDTVETPWSTYPGGEETYDVLLAQSGLPSFGGSPVSLWSTTKLGAQSYIGLLAMDLALGCALPRARKTGKLNVPRGEDPTALLLSDGVRKYLVSTYTVDLIEDEVQVDMTSLPAAELSVEGETYRSMSGGGSASYASGYFGGQAASRALVYDDLPALYIGKTKVQSTSAAQALSGISSLTLEGDKSQMYYDSTNKAWRLSGNLLVDGFVASGGTGSTSGGGSGSAISVGYVASQTSGVLLGKLTINDTEYGIYAPSLTASSINAALGVTPVNRATSDAEGNSISGTYAKAADVPTKVSQLTNDTGYISEINKSMVEGVLTGDITTHTHSQYLTGITKTMVESVLTGGITSHTHTFASLTSRPTTLSGYGITDGLKIDGSNGTADGVSALINKLTIGSSNPTDADYYVCQYAGGGTSTASYHRRPMSAMWNWIKAKTDSLYLPLSGGTISSSSSAPININSTGSESGIWLYLNNTPKGGIWYNPNYGTYLYTYAGPHKLGLKDDGNGYIDTNTILHSGNIKERLSDVNTATSWRFFHSTKNATNKPTAANVYISGVTFATDNNPEYRTQLGLDYNGKVFSRFEAGGKWFDWNQLAFLTDNVASATQLQTSRTIWGQSFNGTADVSGALTNTGTITPSATHKYNIGSPSLVYEKVYTRYIDTDTDYWLRFAVEGTERMIITSAGNVGIGTNAPSYKLHVNGTLGVTGATTLTSLTASGDITTSSKVKAASFTLNGTNLLTWDSDNSAWRFDGNVIVTGNVASGGAGSSASSVAELEARVAQLETQIAALSS